MLNKFEEVLEKWNGGFRGAKIKLARELKVDDSTVSAWLKGRSKPGKDKIIKMAKLFKKSEEEIKAMFVVDNSVTQQAGRDSSGTMTQNIGTASAAEISRLSDKIEILSLKMDKILSALEKLTDGR